MSEAYQCDRCKETYNGEPPNRVETENHRDGMRVLGDGCMLETDYDLCEECGILVHKVLQYELGSENEVNKEELQADE